MMDVVAFSLCIESSIPT